MEGEWNLILKYESRIISSPTTVVMDKSNENFRISYQYWEKSLASYHHNSTSNFRTSRIQNKQKNIDDIPGNSRVKRKTLSDSFPPVCVFCDEKEKYFTKMSKNKNKLINVILLVNFTLV